MKNLAQRVDENIGKIPDFPKAGIQFKDITTLFQNAELCSDMADALAEFSRGKVDAVCGIESRGFLFGFLIAQRLNLPFILVRKQGKLPPPVVSESYDLEYGSATIEVQQKYIEKGQRILIHDDVLATGGTAAATAKLIEKCGGIPAQFSFIADLTDLKGIDKIRPFSSEIFSLIEY